MPGNFRKEDLRITKTINALSAALLAMLCKRGFSRITVHDLCEEALISRATFYAHFCDKYALLQYILTELLDDIINDKDNGLDLMKINKIIQDNPKIIKNTIENADSEVLEMLHKFMASIFEAYLKKESLEKEKSFRDPDYIVLSNFFSGGMVNLLQWQVKNRFPPDVQLMNSFLFGVLDYMAEWNEKKRI